VTSKNKLTESILRLYFTPFLIDKGTNYIKFYRHYLKIKEWSPRTYEKGLDEYFRKILPDFVLATPAEVQVTLTLYLLLRGKVTLDPSSKLYDEAEKIKESWPRKPLDLVDYYHTLASLLVSSGEVKIHSFSPGVFSALKRLSKEQGVEVALESIDIVGTRTVEKVLAVLANRYKWLSLYSIQRFLIPSFFLGLEEYLSLVRGVKKKSPKTKKPILSASKVISSWAARLIDFIMGMGALGIDAYGHLASYEYLRRKTWKKRAPGKEEIPAVRITLAGIYIKKALEENRGEDFDYIYLELEPPFKAYRYVIRRLKSLLREVFQHPYGFPLIDIACEAAETLDIRLPGLTSSELTKILASDIANMLVILAGYNIVNADLRLLLERGRLKVF